MCVGVDGKVALPALNTRSPDSSGNGAGESSETHVIMVSGWGRGTGGWRVVVNTPVYPSAHETFALIGLIETCISQLFSKATKIAMQFCHLHAPLGSIFPMCRSARCVLQPFCAGGSSERDKRQLTEGWQRCALSAR